MTNGARCGSAGGGGLGEGDSGGEVRGIAGRGDGEGALGFPFAVRIGAPLCFCCLFAAVSSTDFCSAAGSSPGRETFCAYTAPGSSNGRNSPMNKGIATLP